MVLKGVFRNLHTLFYTVDKAIDFKECVRLSKENYILLRLARKIKKEEDRTNKLALGLEFEVALDKEELKLFKGIFKSKVQ